MTDSEGEARVAQAQGRSGQDQGHEDRQQEWLQSLLSDVWQSRLDFYGELIDKVSDDRYPSPKMLDTIESGIPPELYPAYLAVLVQKVFDSKYPSPTLLARLERLSRLPGSPQLAGQRG